MVAEKFLPESPTTRFEIKSCRALTKQQNPPVTDLFSTLTVVAAVAGAIGMAGSAVLAAIKLAVFLYGFAIDRALTLGTCTLLLSHDESPVLELKV
ncbi:hypothetical protein RO22_06730 [Halomonas sp. KHS3]|jgi:hypothetical protein|uniref:Uncharacterized protein n=1 Tax=Vreelandella titanicae TaxID=664683 RepID=A0AAP9SZI4_9GAMM|nr:hypothetical protein RO22_06730 [Halomonas sp. KHS3]QKS22671.1 hypothetical protein FX987_00422 [Halomonas titanicae]|tara:strand:- start:305 stop:592 length:288 start_codon:yes stop_codon:yes gene_type:complete